MVITEGTRTPWGRADTVVRRFPGFYEVGTPSHGGIYVSPELADQMPPMFRNRRWYEEDCDWAIPYFVFRNRLRETGNKWVLRNLENVEGTLTRWQPPEVLQALGLKKGATCDK